METPKFGRLGVCVEGFTKESLYTFLQLQQLAELLDEKYFRDDSELDHTTYLQSESFGPYTEEITLNVHGGFVHYVTDMDNFLLILRTGLLDEDAANSLIDELYTQGLIKPRNI